MAAPVRSTLCSTLLPLFLLASPSVSRCDISTAPGSGELRVSGTLHFLSAEGGCWQLVAVDGSRFELRTEELPDEVRREGTRVTLVGTALGDVAGPCDAGTVFAIDRVVHADPG
jgi:hypothetical protein